MKTKKEIKVEYKQMRFRMGVFQIRNIFSGKLFIGSSVNLDKIWNRHKFQLEMNGHQSKGLQQDWNEQGAENFVFEVVEELKESDDSAVDNQKDVALLEEMVVEKLKPEYNK